MASGFSVSGKPSRRLDGL